MTSVCRHATIRLLLLLLCGRGCDHPNTIVVPAGVSLAEMTIWTNSLGLLPVWTVDATEMDIIVADSHQTCVAFPASTGGSKMMTIQWVNRWSTVSEGDADSEKAAASAGAVGRAAVMQTNRSQKLAPTRSSSQSKETSKVSLVEETVHCSAMAPANGFPKVARHFS